MTRLMTAAKTGGPPGTRNGKKPPLEAAASEKRKVKREKLRYAADGGIIKKAKSPRMGTFFVMMGESAGPTA